MNELDTLINQVLGTVLVQKKAIVQQTVVNDANSKFKMQMCMLQIFSWEWSELDTLIWPEEYMQCILA